VAERWTMAVVALMSLLFVLWASKQRTWVNAEGINFEGMFRRHKIGWAEMQRITFRGFGIEIRKTDGTAVSALASTSRRYGDLETFLPQCVAEFAPKTEIRIFR